MTRSLSVSLAAEIDQEFKSAHCRILFLLFMLVLRVTQSHITINMSLTTWQRSRVESDMRDVSCIGPNLIELIQYHASDQNHHEDDNHRREAVYQDFGCQPSDHQEYPDGKRTIQRGLEEIKMKTTVEDELSQEVEVNQNEEPLSPDKFVKKPVEVDVASKRNVLSCCG